MPAAPAAEPWGIAVSPDGSRAFLVGHTWDGLAVGDEDPFCTGETSFLLALTLNDPLADQPR